MNYRQNIVLIFLSCFINLIECNSVKRITNQLKRFRLQIPGYSPIENNDYVAASFKAEPGYITKFEPFASAERVHHMLLYGCNMPAMNTSFWRGSQTCSGRIFIIYAWARNALPFTMPKNVAFGIGNSDDPIQYLVLQIHYAQPFQGNVRDFSGITLHLSDIRPKYIADVFLFVSSQPIPPHQSAFYNNVSCNYNENIKLYPIAFRVHTHAMGRVVSGFVKQTNSITHELSWNLIGKRNPLWPQLFEPIHNKNLVISKGDFIAITCRFDSSNKDRWTSMGSMGVDEMCNFYMMYYRDANDLDPFPYGAICGINEDSELVKAEYPIEGTTLLPSNLSLEHGGHQRMTSFGVSEQFKSSNIDDIKLGQISGLAFDNKGKIVIFHRASVTWDYETFDNNNILRNRSPINDYTVLVANFDDTTKSVNLSAKYGKNLFYMPHGIFIDESNYYYTTDVGSHQVIKWEIFQGELRPVWKLGELYVPGSDQFHFCKPTSIAVSRIDGSIYVSDGYCNSRVIKFSNDGKFIAQWGYQSYSRGTGREYSGGNLNLGFFSLPHDISLNEREGKVYVSDRENGRIQVFNNNGTPLYDLKDPSLYQTVFSAHYCEDHGVIFIPGNSPNLPKSYEINAYVVPNNSTQIEYSFRPTTGKFFMPHIIRARDDVVWVGEISGNEGTLWRFIIEKEKAIMHKEPVSNKLLLKSNSINDDRINNNVEVITENFWSTIFVLVALITIFYVFCYYCFCSKSKSLLCWHKIFCCCLKKQNQSTQNLIDRTGFEPLKNLDDDEDDESDDDDDFLSIKPSPLLKH